MLSGDAATIYPALLAIPLLFLPVFIINMVGQDVVINIYEGTSNICDTWIEVAGGVLPAIRIRTDHEYDRKEQTDSFRILRLYRSIRWRSKLINSWNYRNLYCIYYSIPETGNCRGGKRT